MLKLHGENRIQDEVKENAQLVCQTIAEEMKDNESIEPLPILMNGSMNVITSFVTGRSLRFDDPQFHQFSAMIKVNIILGF